MQILRRLPTMGDLGDMVLFSPRFRLQPQAGSEAGKEVLSSSIIFTNFLFVESNLTSFSKERYNEASRFPNPTSPVSSVVSLSDKP
ncbi:hypothetical protein KPH14_006005 [Odynerus spinipes]|uniref:Uncharacterized protein n=1 Tax=Odynerus spinipes TaxID=1348599 RepID=A0AAD9VNA6_9HYME|nr:hypothetical protein KPH14_006005 [Odynerus spinipes]